MKLICAFFGGFLLIYWHCLIVKLSSCHILSIRVVSLFLRHAPHGPLRQFHLFFHRAHQLCHKHVCQSCFPAGPGSCRNALFQPSALLPSSLERLHVLYAVELSLYVALPRKWHAGRFFFDKCILSSVFLRWVSGALGVVWSIFPFVHIHRDTCADPSQA